MSSVAIQVNITGLKRLQNFAEQFPDIAEPYFNQAISKALARILGAEKTEAPFGVSGILRDNWQLTTGRFTGQIVSMAPYAAAVHEGTAPHMPPVDAITPWANKRGISPWAVAMSIKKKGTKANPFLTRAINDVEDNISDDFANALEQAVAQVNNQPDS